MRKLMYYFITITILGSFVLLMNSGDFLKKPRGQSDNVVLYVEALEQDVKNEEWQKAKTNFNKLQTSWDKVITRIQFSVEKDEINAINVSLARLEAYVMVNDKNQALAEVREIIEHWNNLNN